MKVRSAGPNAVERRGDVARRLTEVDAATKVGKPTLTVSVAVRRSQGIESHAIGADLVDRHPLFRILAAGAIRAVAIGTNAIECDPAALGERLVDRKRIFWRLN